MFDLLGSRTGRIINNLWFFLSPLLPFTRFMFSSHIVLCLIFFRLSSKRYRECSAKMFWSMAVCARTASKLQYLSTVAWENQTLALNLLARSLAKFTRTKLLQQFLSTDIRWAEKTTKNSDDEQETHKAPQNIKIIWKSACNTKCYFHHHASYLCLGLWMDWNYFHQNQPNLNHALNIIKKE